MAKSNSYMDRALRSSDPRFARVLGKLGYQRSDMTDDNRTTDELSDLREQYQAKFGKRAYHGWDADTLREKLAEE